MKTLASNKKAYFNFDILDKLEAGIVLNGWEVKSIKGGRLNLAGAYIKESNGEVYLVNANVPLYKFASEPQKGLEQRDRKLLLNRSEIVNINSKAKQKGSTIIPLEVIENDKGMIKVVIALVKGRKKFDKRMKLKEADMKDRIDKDRKKYNF